VLLYQQVPSPYSTAPHNAVGCRIVRRPWRAINVSRTNREREGAMDEEIKLQLDVEKDTYETFGKAANLLLVANAAGMAACLTVLKEPDTNEIYKGIGLLLVMLGLGLLSAIWGYSLISVCRIYKMRELIGLEKDSRIFRLANNVIFPALFFSMINFTGAIWFLMGRFWLK
jgi:hypothetical protein